MISIYEDKRSIESDRFYKLLSQNDIQTIEDNLSIKLIT